jgi:genome maintenance exonuclease 1
MHIFNHVDGILPIEMKAEMIDGKRYYVTPTGGKYPSITTVISNNAKKQAGLAKWRARVGKEKAQAKTTRGCNRGTRYHKLVEDYINNELDTNKYKDMPLPWTMFHSSRAVLDRINRVYLQEAALYSDHLQIAGRVDCIAEYEGELSIIDFKTAEAPKREQYLYDYFVQECGYACMLQEVYGVTVKKLVTIVACENGDTQVKVMPPKKEYFVRLQEYIREYQDKYARQTRG